MSAFQDFQRDFARHLRDPHHVRRPAGVPARRAAVYQELLFNNVCGFLDKCFPVSREILGDSRWRRLNRSFYRDWPQHSPLFRNIPREFVDYIASGSAPQQLPAYLPELLHYEWAELAVDIMPAAPPAHDRTADLLEHIIVLNPAMLVLSYHWPVHRIGPEYRPRKPVATHLVIHRDADHHVRFCEINAVTARLLTLLGERAQSGAAAFNTLAQELQHPDPAALRSFGAQVLSDLKNQGIILGAAR